MPELQRHGRRSRRHLQVEAARRCIAKDTARIRKRSRASVNVGLHPHLNSATHRRRLTALELLALDDNALRELPAGLGQLGKLHTLTVSNNKLEALPEMGGMRALEELNVVGKSAGSRRDAIEQLSRKTT